MNMFHFPLCMYMLRNSLLAVTLQYSLYPCKFQQYPLNMCLFVCLYIFLSDIKLQHSPCQWNNL